MTPNKFLEQLSSAWSYQLWALLLGSCSCALTGSRERLKRGTRKWPRSQLSPTTRIDTKRNRKFSLGSLNTKGSRRSSDGTFTKKPVKTSMMIREDHQGIILTAKILKTSTARITEPQTMNPERSIDRFMKRKKVLEGMNPSKGSQIKARTIVTNLTIPSQTTKTMADTAPKGAMARKTVTPSWSTIERRKAPNLPNMTKHYIKSPSNIWATSEEGARSWIPKLQFLSEKARDPSISDQEMAAKTNRLQQTSASVRGCCLTTSGENMQDDQWHLLQ